MPRLPGKREVYRVANAPEVGRYDVYLAIDGWLACHNCIRKTNEHLFIGPNARAGCLKDLARALQALVGVNGEPELVLFASTW